MHKHHPFFSLKSALLNTTHNEKRQKERFFFLTLVEFLKKKFPLVPKTSHYTSLLYISVLTLCKKRTNKNVCCCEVKLQQQQCHICLYGIRLSCTGKQFFYSLRNFSQSSMLFFVCKNLRSSYVCVCCVCVFRWFESSATATAIHNN